MTRRQQPTWRQGLAAYACFDRPAFIQRSSPDGQVAFHCYGSSNLFLAVLTDDYLLCLQVDALSFIIRRFCPEPAGMTVVMIHVHLFSCMRSTIRYGGRCRPSTIECRLRRIALYTHTYMAIGQYNCHSNGRSARRQVTVPLCFPRLPIRLSVQ